ncbi:helix-turn-helix domain-containing protein [Natronolimnohabitans sp. A-GB9]|uniref:winged helix-turn-helix domain-containing protein n=1 Tax=Natronolimnohabitans sp. A-GB9 TaxID=3069757 RepID=UPI0027B2348F|nr:helix-turn-helix domain-containing protein [Natronolimnohabitans sp. A-GB9]MDQ2052086.1 helix-turn-helix domain-containing protein [Natronolimnohabitans sp. A-GB9]
MSLEFSSSGDTPDFEHVIGALDDADCREIIAVLEEPKTVPDIAEAADLPLSTTYRKLDRLTEAGLVSETVGVRQGRHHKSRYVTTFDRIGIDLDDGRELRVDVDYSQARSLGIWSELSREF